ncbi:MAG TPA: hypothetical protein VKP30_26430 [Polyangiaceae bacterium]|nr:hypothetical protein [Polyangiaceae bacterium]
MRKRTQQTSNNHGMLCSHRIAACLLCALAFIGCASGAAGGGRKGVATARSRTVEHEPCAEDSKPSEQIDVNGDGAPDLTVIKKDGRESCRAADLDFDGRIDMWSYFDESGRVRRRELDYDRDGNVDEIQLFKAGEIAEKHRASTPAKRLDTWEFYSGGRLVRAERDSDSDGQVDQWWDFKTPDCPLIRTDADGNGQPDAKAEVDYCKESGYKPPEQAAPSVAPMLQKDTAALPTETSNQPASTEKTETGGSGEADAKAKSTSSTDTAPTKTKGGSNAPGKDAR